MQHTIRNHLVALGPVLVMTITMAFGEEAVPSESHQKLTLIDTYKLALIHSETLAIGEAEWKGAESRYHQARSRLRPELELSGSARWDHVDTDESADRTTRAGLRGSYVIFDGFRSTRIAAARAAESDALEFDLKRERQLLFEDVADVFYQTLATEAELATLGAELAALESRLAELGRRVKLGRSRPAEELSAQTQLADTRVTLEQIRAERDAARELLIFLIGETGASCELLDDTALPDAGDVAAFLSKLEERPDVQAADAMVQSELADERAAASERNVTLEADGAIYALSDPGESGDWDIGLSLSLPVFDGGLRRAVVAEQHADLRVSELELAQLRRVADRDVRMAWRELTGLLAQWSALQSAVQAAQANVDGQQKDYDMGRSSNLDVISAMTQLQSLRRRDAVLSLQAKAALVRLHVAAGLVAPVESSP